MRLAVALVALLVLGGVTLGLISRTFTGSLSSPVAASPSPNSGNAAPGAEPTTLPRSVLAAAQPGDPPDAATIASRIKAVSRSGVGGVYSGSVVDVRTGKTLFAHRAGTAEIPASVNKLLTSAAVLAELGPEHRFTTKVVLGGKQAGKTRIILVGGGDPYLARKTTAATYPARASVADLAAKTATALKKQKVSSVRLGYDASLFTGPAWNPTWPSGYADQVTATSALWVDEGRLAGASPGPRTSDPAGQAAKAFATALKKRGIKVADVDEAKAGKGDATLAAVSSMPLERIVEQVLMASDNDAAEVLFRQVAVAAGRPGSISQARKQVRVTLTKLKAWHEDTVVHDGSGLSRDDRVGADTLSSLLRLGAHSSHPELRGLIIGLPVAGVEGSPKHRFFEPDAVSARGVVRGKTGTLRRVSSLAGFVRTSDGSLLVYAFIANEVTGEFAAKTWLDEVTASVASCGCQG